MSRQFWGISPYPIQLTCYFAKLFSDRDSKRAPNARIWALSDSISRSLRVECRVSGCKRIAFSPGHDMPRANKSGPKSTSDSEGDVRCRSDLSSARISKISSLLSELAELMQQENIGKEALHHLKQLQMRVRFANINTEPRESSNALPTQAPRRWSVRESDLSPAEFIRRHYAPWLGKGLTRAHIRHLDISLYEALKRWLKENEMPEDVDLPTKKEMIDRELAGGSDFKIVYSPEQRRKLSLYRAARRRATRKT
jgi:hypothetical protein